ncbi:MAG TPA: hypothetical protein VKG25_28530 [Bryobacteraceae bacterium]|nr:hypothetical protein [Bryobacteraceae bacterium]
MLPRLLVPENIASADGVGPVLELGADRETPIVLTLAIDRVVEQETLQVSIWGSADNQEWGPRPLTSFPPKSYCGIYSQLLNMARHKGVRYLRAEWKVSRWSNPASAPLFEFCLMAEESGLRLKRAVSSATRASEPAAAVA